MHDSYAHHAFVALNEFGMSSPMEHSGDVLSFNIRGSSRKPSSFRILVEVRELLQEPGKYWVMFHSCCKLIRLGRALLILL
jgi:hypothetical protein